MYVTRRKLKAKVAAFACGVSYLKPIQIAVKLKKKLKTISNNIDKSSKDLGHIK